MPSRTRALDDIIERRRREREIGGERLVSLRLGFALNDELLWSVGGVWDRRAVDYVAPSTTGVMVRIHAGQLRALQWFAAWMDAHAERRASPPTLTAIDIETYEVDTDPTRVYSALFAGGRRAGKTWLAVALAVAYAIRFPGAIVWLVSPNDEKHDEFRRYMSLFVASTWVEHQTEADGWELCNGSRLLLKSGYGTGDGLKEGEAHLVVLNEGQMMKARAFTVTRGAIVDSSGLVLVCANPPVETKDEQWVADFAAEASAGRRASVLIEFNPLENPHIDRRALLAFRADVDERTFAIEVLGQFRGPKDAVAYNWNRLENERPVPVNEPDVTAAFLASIEEGPGIEQVVGLDVQRFPYIGGPVYRFYGFPERGVVLAWIVDEIVLEGGDELDWCDALWDKGYSPATTLIVCDASGQYQHSRRRSTDSPPPEWRGRGSFDLIKGEGYRRIVPPSRRMKKNPQIVDRARAFTSMISTGSGVKRLFADPEKAPLTCKAIREWKTVHGTPSRSQEVAHLGDGASYPIVRFFPRLLRADSNSRKPRHVDPVVSRVDKPFAIASEPAVSILPPTRGPSGGRGARFRGL